MASSTMLSRNDKGVLSALFDSEGMPSKEGPRSSQRSSFPGISSTILRDLQQREASAIRPLNSESPSQEQIEQSIRVLTRLIEEQPLYPSARNNRAQAVRMLFGDDLTNPAASSSTLYTDLCEAIRLSSPTGAHPEVSSLQSKILASSHTHRGHLLYKCSKSLAKDPSRSKDLPAELQGADSSRLEKMAAADFRSGGKYGNEIAKQMAVQLNPYAKLCGEIVREAMINDMKESGVIPATSES